MGFSKLIVAAISASVVSSYDSYNNYIPNADVVPWEGGFVVALGHPTPTAETASRNNANPFGATVYDAVHSIGKDATAVWAAVCDKDDDGDGLTNGEELCDPDCNHAGGHPTCAAGKVLTHPGFHNEKEFVYKHDPQFVGHGVLMFFAWCMLAPYAIIRVALYKKRPVKSLPPRWLKEHQYIFYAIVVITYSAFFVILPNYGTELINFAFDLIGTGEVRDSRADIHAVLGIFVMTGVTIQPISGYFRAKLPKPGEKKSLIRMLWEIQHQWTGRITFLLAMWAAATGLPIAFPDHGRYASRVMLSIVGIASLSTVIYVLHFRDLHVQMIKEREEAAKNQVAQSYSQDAAEVRESKKSVREQLSQIRESLVGSMIRSKAEDPNDLENEGAVIQSTL